MGSTELNENWNMKGDILEVSDDTPMYNPQWLPLNFVLHLVHAEVYTGLKRKILHLGCSAMFQCTV